MKLAKFFISSAGVLLLTTAVAKLISAAGNALVLKVYDPVLLIPLRYLLLIAGIFELMVALFCFFGRRTGAQACVIAWLATNFLVYRIAFILGGYRKPCPCLGDLAQAIHIPQRIADTVTSVVLAYLLVASYAALFWLWRRRKRVCPAPISTQ